ncbi:hypothetical protein P3459_002473 [Escherichia coli]|nr:hypothetical protein [Escherichia coli]MCJ8642509.1 hypothetical protein [Escherichia coli]
MRNNPDVIRAYLGEA